MKRGALLATIVLAACATSSADPRASAPSTDPIALFDAHVHYSAERAGRLRGVGADLAAGPSEDVARAIAYGNAERVFTAP